MQEWEWGLPYNFTAEYEGIRYARAERKRGDFSMNDMFVDSFNGEFGNAATCSPGLEGITSRPSCQPSVIISPLSCHTYFMMRSSLRRSSSLQWQTDKSHAKGGNVDLI